MMTSVMSFPPHAAAAAVLAVAALVMAVAGAAKIVRPVPTVTALKTAGIKIPVSLVRGLSLFELFIAGAALTDAGAAWRILLAGSYVAFAGFVAFALARHIPLASCGCFGEPDTPPTALHVWLNGLLAAAPLVAVLQRAPSPGHVLADSPGDGVVAAIGVAVATGCCLLVLTALPRLAAEARGARQRVLGPERRTT